MCEIPNLNYIESLAGEDEEFKTKIIDIIKKEFREEKLKYERLLAKHDLKEIAGIIHKIKHKISILGYEKGYLVAEAYENSLKEQSPLDTDLQIKFEKLLKQMDDFIAKL
jgi:HPt (histidine-containing phosphotransfer) domain-containing protein